MRVPSAVRRPLAVLTAAALAAAVVGALAFPTALPVVAQPNSINNCTTITQPGEYHLTGDITNGGDGDNFTYISGSCIVVASSNVTLDGEGHTVDGMGVSDTTAIEVAGNGTLENVVVRDVRVDQWNRAVYLSNVSNATVRGVNATGNSFGVYAEDSANVTVRNLSSDTHFVGIYLDDATATLEGNRLDGGHTAVLRAENASA